MESVLRKYLETKTLFEVKDLSKKGLFHDINFKIKKGEIVGFAGLVGAGRTEMSRAIFGAEPADSGEIWINGKKIAVRQTKQAISNNIGYLSEDRKNHGLYLGFEVKDNVVANQLESFTGRIGFLNRNKIERFAQKNIE
jgi:ribose transport system ATP-binding protein